MADRIADSVRLRDLRERRLLTQKALAVLAGVSERTIKHAESGKHAPSGIVLHKLAQAFEVPVSDLLIDQDADAA
jgi:XRE family transcriptional regulator, aerobic/anaerobic benzoate catabolism transcriptional regulator